MKKILFLLAPLFCLNAQVDLSYYLGDTSNYNQSIPTPESIIGHQVGELHVSHDKLSHYVQEVSKNSDRVKLVNRGKTYENRVSWLMIITSESNQSRLEEIRQNHLELSNSKNIKPNYALILNISKDHLDWHGNFNNYRNSKMKIFSMQDKFDYALLNDKNLIKIFKKNKKNI